jgi:dipeptidyl aminopeptidase/acylaminoacyl peptidase
LHRSRPEPTANEWLADRGYAVLSVNYRGSTGFGKAFVAAGEKQHAARMHDDLIDMVEWAIGEGIAQRDRIAIFGVSWGGFAAFIGATFTPEVFCCCEPIVGITNLQTLLESMPPYWAGFAEFMYRSYGDPRTPEGRALLAERSPIPAAASKRVPLTRLPCVSSRRAGNAWLILPAQTSGGLSTSIL